MGDYFFCVRGKNDNRTAQISNHCMQGRDRDMQRQRNNKVGFTFLWPGWVKFLNFSRHKLMSSNHSGRPGGCREGHRHTNRHTLHTPSSNWVSKQLKLISHVFCFMFSRKKVGLGQRNVFFWHISDKIKQFQGIVLYYLAIS